MFPKKRNSAAVTLEINQPLYKRAPGRDENGKPVADFMLLIPGLRDLPKHLLRQKVAVIQAVLVNFAEVVFADLNIRLNILWVSYKPKPGIMAELTGALNAALPESVVVGQPAQL